jgi:hypothetical protein
VKKTNDGTVSESDLWASYFSFSAYVVSIVCRLAVLDSLIQLKDGIHRHHENLVDLAGNGIINVLEVFCSSRNARDISVQRDELGGLYSLCEEEDAECRLIGVRENYPLTVRAFSYSACSVQPFASRSFCN